MIGAVSNIAKCHTAAAASQSSQLDLAISVLFFRWAKRWLKIRFGTLSEKTTQLSQAALPRQISVIV